MVNALAWDARGDGLVGLYPTFGGISEICLSIRYAVSRKKGRDMDCVAFQELTVILK